MLHHVIVEFGKDHSYEFKFQTGELTGTPEESRQWFDDQFNKLGCEFTTPTGKVLIIDKILNVAKKAGESRFSSNEPWASQYARNAAQALERELIRIDISGSTIGY